MEKGDIVIVFKARLFFVSYDAFFYPISLYNYARFSGDKMTTTPTITTRRRVPRGKCDEFFFEKRKMNDDEKTINGCCCCSCCNDDDEHHSVVLFYKYVALSRDCLPSLRDALEKEMTKLEVRGKIRVSVEGINATASGRESAVEEFERRLKKKRGDGGEDELLFEMLELKDVDFKTERVKRSEDEEDGRGCKHIFEDASVRIVDEVCPFEPSSKKNDKKASIDGVGLERHRPNRLTPSEWREAIRTSDDDDVVVLDVRNSYESRMGRFVPEKTVCCPIRRFNQFKEWVEEKGGKEYIENKRVFAYCTGGVRCEKASAYLLSLNVTKEVSVLEGGIVAYARDVGGDGFVGKNYVFDARGCVDVGDDDDEKNNYALTTCDGCNAPCLPRLARCASKACHVILAACKECSKSSTSSIYCCETCKANKDGEKKLACECDSYRSRESRCKVPAAL